MQATKRLLAHYAAASTLDLSTNRPALLGLSAASVVVLVAATWLVLRLLPLLRPAREALSVRFGLGELVLGVIALVLIVSGGMVLHEALHGVSIWAVTCERPVFGLRGLYAYAAAPAWYLPRWPYVLIALAPLVIISSAGVALLAVVPAGWLPAVVALIVFNSAGAVGDLLVVAWVLRQPASVLIRDTGDAFTLYLPDRSRARTH